ncbi:hypothetical protein P3535_17725 [Vibrio parahaemolyticus]|uniref:hypothetical protein n=2 Tax=Vibrio parahaemolyticus TaxID=670 RepID=UPI00186A8EC1|nr:hypothetical protein [Vibrio parahaemolyticus]ELB2959661.1 hypothetical protein [Vibrio parahaemolyticus]MBE4433877.1 hypothetical protein [Vibrio parahaemolyticus]MCC3790301.1 hypothetical protein [Vibrio parahaemolyticus]MDF4814370.1 hypothetical protein [Vibrio parahaemolyticus]MDF4829382.1 hypothetical protein [Vibrio parahaemolyticus]
MANTCISQFLEDMDHEFTDIPDTVKLKGFKVDGTSGIKPFCKLSELKSVDYFYENAESSDFVFFEFSNLPAQRLSLERIAENLAIAPDMDMTKKELVKVRKKIKAEIQQELVKKFNDSSLINMNMRSELINIPESFSNIPKYMIVVPPIDSSKLGPKAGDIARFLDQLKGTVRNSIPKQMCGGVKIQDVRGLF